MLYKEILSAFAIALTVIAFLPYIRAIKRGKTTPHIFSWIVWATAVTIVSFAQLADGGGVGAWPFLASGLLTYYIAFLAYQRRNNLNITRIDWLLFVAAVFSLPVWYFMSDPLGAVLVLIGVEICAFTITIRKAYTTPHEEQTTFFVLMVIRNICAMIALEHYSPATLLFPTVIVMMCMVLIMVIILRKRVIQPS